MMGLLVFLLLDLLNWLSFAQAAPAPQADTTAMGAGANPERLVEVILDLDLTTRWNQFGAQDETLLPAHAQLHVAQSNSDGAARIQVLFDGSTADTYVDMLDFGRFSQDPGIYPGYGMARKIIGVGTTTVTNAQLLDDNNNAAGILRDIWTDPSQNFQGEFFEGRSDCVTFVDGLVKDARLGISGNPQWDNYAGLYKEWVNAKIQANPGSRSVINNVGLRYRLVVSSDATTNRITVFPVDSGSQAIIPASPATTRTVTVFQNPLSPGDNTRIPIATPNEEHQLTPPKTAGGFQSLPPPFQNCRRSLQERSGCSPPSEESLDDVTFAKVDGVTTMLAMTEQAAVQVVGIAGAALGAVVVILDFVAGNWKGAAFGAANLALGVAVGIGMDTPMGWLIGGLITAFFTLLPRLFGSHTATQPKNNNITQIIQYEMFGDASHTGNEQCQKTNPACQAVYGPGVIAMSFGWEYFDAVTFLINANEGYPMTIPNMAAAFTFNSNGNATVHCDGPTRNSNAYSQLSTNEDPTVCYSPRFTLNRNAIVLPNIQQTAAQVYNRIIPNPGGDCKLIDNASNSLFFSAYNVTATGLPVAIACNITAGTDVEGTVVPLGSPPSSPSGAPVQSVAAAPSQAPSPAGLPPGTAIQTSGAPGQSSGAVLLLVNNGTNNPPQSSSTSQLSPALASAPATSSSVSSNNIPLYSSGNEATNGQAGAYIAPPPATPFQIPFNSTNSVCFSGPSAASCCFPNGTYVPQTGMYGYTTTNLNSMSIPPGASVTVTTRPDQQAKGSSSLTTYSFNQTNQYGWNSVISQFNAKLNEGIMYIDAPSPPLPPPPPAACLFSQPNWTGQVFCLGLGGGNLSVQQANTAQSIIVFGGATAYLFAESGYADGSETPITTNIADLKSEPFGVNDNFSEKTKAVWIAGP